MCQKGLPRSKPEVRPIPESQRVTRTAPSARDMGTFLSAAETPNTFSTTMGSEPACAWACTSKPSTATTPFPMGFWPPERMHAHLDRPGVAFFGAQVRLLPTAWAAGPATGPVPSSFKASPGKLASHCSAKGSLPEGESKAISTASFAPGAPDPEETRTLCPSRGNAQSITPRLRMLFDYTRIMRSRQTSKQR